MYPPKETQSISLPRHEERSGLLDGGGTSGVSNGMVGESQRRESRDPKRIKLVQKSDTRGSSGKVKYCPLFIM